MRTPQVTGPASTAVAPGHRRDIQGLRAVAVLLVVLAHAGVGFLSGGFVGVDVFFVLSGFLITGLLLAEARAHGSVSLVDFYVRRARRILPAAALTLLVTNIAAFYVLNFVRARAAVDDGLHAGAFAANFHFAARGVDYFSRDNPPSPVLHYWSLSVEEQFYVVWPLLLSVALFGVALRRRAHAGHERRLLGVVLALAAASLVYSVHLTATAPTIAYFSPFTRAWELGLGAAIAVCGSMLARIPAAARVVMGWAGVAAIAVAAVAFTERTPFPGSAGLLPTVGTACAIVAGIGATTPRLAVSRLLSVRPMFVIGDRSYALYLWHWPMLILADAYAGHELSVPVKLAVVAGAFLLSCASYALVENPIRHRVRSRRTTGLVVAVCTVAFLGSSAVSLAGIDRAQQRFEAAPANGIETAAVVRSRSGSAAAKGAVAGVVAAVEAARRGAPIPSGLTPPIDKLGPLPRRYAPPNVCIGHDQTGDPVKTSVCRIGDVSSKRVIMLLGDSHAMEWLPPLLETAWRDHWAVVPLLRLGCSPAKWTSSYGSDGCHAWFRWATQTARRLQPDVILVGGNVAEKPSPVAQAGVEAVVTAVQALQGSGTVVVIGDPEGLDREPVDCLLSKHASMASCMTTWPSASLAVYDEVGRRVTRLGAGFLGTRRLVCFRGSCPAVIGRTIVWADNNHLTAAYTAGLTPEFRTALRRAIAKLSHATEDG